MNVTRSQAAYFAAESDALDYLRLRERMAIKQYTGPDAVGIAHEARLRINAAHRQDNAHRRWSVY